MISERDFDTLPVRAQEERLRALALAALDHWDGEWRAVRLIKYRENAVFEAADANGTRRALRIHRPGYHSDAELRSELAWMDALGADGIALPKPVRARNGALLISAKLDIVPHRRQVDMFEWVDGVALSHVHGAGPLVDAYRKVGSLVASIHGHAATWQRPSDFRRQAWNADGLIGDRPLWGDYRALWSLTAADRQLFETATAAAVEQLATLPASEYALIHADLVPDNLLLCGDGVKAIDFDDAGFGWRMFDIATILFHHLGEPIFGSLEQALLEGYRAVRRLSDETYATMPLFLFLRGLTYLSWIHSRSGTATAREMAPHFISRTRDLAREYLKSHSWCAEAPGRPMRGLS